MQFDSFEFIYLVLFPFLEERYFKLYSIDPNVKVKFANFYTLEESNVSVNQTAMTQQSSDEKIEIQIL